MKIAVHHSKGSFSDRWITYCEAQNIPYKIVDCYKSDIIRQLVDCDALMWHFHHASHKDVLFAKQLVYSVKASGKQVFPDFETAWHFDDKVGQKYLLEAIGAPLVPSYVFYTKKEALEWADHTTFPKVFKLRGGAGSANVRLARKKSNALNLINKAFGNGFSQYEGWSNLKERIRIFRNGKTTLFDVLKGFIRLFYTTDFAKMHGKEKGYIYFQDFISNNDSDIRVIVIDEKAFAIKRMVRKNDFRASGSGEILYEKELFDLETIKLSFDIANKLHTQCLAFDFVYRNGKPLVVEINYGFSVSGYDPCVGYWTEDMKWHNGSFNPQAWMVELIVKKIEAN
ncbi:MAG: hypothetical protein NTY07_12410 [Bacteroidia bacterium]|nr:hypothetical protein [Bacteroidia bacterium]